MSDHLAAAVAAADAGAAVSVRYFDSSYSVSYKDGGDPLTEADLASNHAIHALLTQAFPTYGWASEEADPTEELPLGVPIWVVDPLDGTLEFVQRIPEWCVSIALAQGGSVIAGVCYNPISRRLIAGERGAGVTSNGEQVRVTETGLLAKASVLASRTETSRGLWDPFAGVFEVVAVGSVAYKMALVASGEADATFSLAPKHGWDVAAGTLLVEEAGGTVTDLEGTPLRFDRPTGLIRGLIASNGHLHDQLIEAIGAAAGHRDGRDGLPGDALVSSAPSRSAGHADEVDDRLIR